jgi:hypothetical protein
LGEKTRTFILFNAVNEVKINFHVIIYLIRAPEQYVITRFSSPGGKKTSAQSRTGVPEEPGCGHAKFATPITVHLSVHPSFSQSCIRFHDGDGETAKYSSATKRNAFHNVPRKAGHRQGPSTSIPYPHLPVLSLWTLFPKM